MLVTIIFLGVIKELKNKCKLIEVLGYNDGERIHLLENFLGIKGDLKGQVGEIKLD
jgi:hypothetical protein